MQILAIVSSNLEKASTYYRLTQYLPLLKNEGVDVEFVTRDSLSSETIKKAADVDVVLNLRCLTNLHIAKKIFKAGKRVIFDFDDAIYTRPGRPHSFITDLRVRKRLRQWLQNSDVVSTSNNVLADYAHQHASAAEVIPMGLDLEKWRPVLSTNDSVTIGWAGAPVNIPNIERIDGVFTELQNRFQNLKIAVYSGQRPKLTCEFSYHPYTPEGEIKFIQNLDIGLLPLVYDVFAKGKSPIKAVQYIACGIPVVGNIEGGTSEILNAESSIAVAKNDEWIDGLAMLIKDREMRERMGHAGRQFALDHHDVKVISRKLMGIFSG